MITNIIAILCLSIPFMILIYGIIINLPYGQDKCFKDKENKGYVHNDKCPGCYGGDWKTDYLSETCCDCKHLELTSNLK